MSNSGLCKYDCRSVLHPGQHYTSRTDTISIITIHCMAGISPTAQECPNWWSGRKASSNYGIGNDGSIGLYVDESNRTYCSSSSVNDNKAVTIEVSNNTNSAEPEWPVDDKAMASLVLLCTDICRRNGIASLRWDPSDQLHPTTPNGNMTAHRWFASKSCPGNYLYNRMGKIAESVNGLIASGETSFTWDSATMDGSNMATAMSMTSNSGASLNIDVTQLTPLVITVDPSVTVKYRRLKDNGVSGLMFEAGYLYESSTHKEVPYRNTNLDKQVKACNKQKDDDGNLLYRFALYTIVRSRNVNEARKECKQLYYTVSKYPPGMGVWLKIEFPKSQKKKTNDKILEYYYEQLTQWGLEQGCGLYCDKKQLKNISWDKLQEKYLLWYINHFTKEEQFSQIDQLMVPEFFTLDAPEIVTPANMNATSTASSDGTIPASTTQLSGNTTGEQVVNYARQFIGNPYVWGGTSLTNGCDCSGFTMRIFEHFGVSLPHSSSSQRSYGTHVDASNIHAGDLICYNGHVAIYNGSGGCVHASNKKDGIKESSSYTYKAVVDIRRLV